MQTQESKITPFPKQGPGKASYLWVMALASNFVVSLRNKHFICVCIYFDVEIKIYHRYFRKKHFISNIFPGILNFDTITNENEGYK